MPRLRRKVGVGGGEGGEESLVEGEEVIIKQYQKDAPFGMKYKEEHWLVDRRWENGSYDLRGVDGRPYPGNPINDRRIKRFWDAIEDEW